MPRLGRLLVTGAAGFVGRHLLARLRERFPAAELIAACRAEDGARALPHGADRVVPFDLLEPEACAAMIAEIRPDGLVHLAAQASVATSFIDPRASWRANLIDFNHTGAGQSESFVVASFARQIARIEAGQQPAAMQVGALDRWRDFLDVRDVCAAYVSALEAGSVSGEVYNIASGTPRRIGDILAALMVRSGVTPVVDVEPVRLRPTDVERVVGNAARAQRDLGWAPVVPWDETLDAVLSDWRGRIA